MLFVVCCAVCFLPSILLITTVTHAKSGYSQIMVEKGQPFKITDKLQSIQWSSLMGAVLIAGVYC